MGAKNVVEEEDVRMEKSPVFISCFLVVGLFAGVSNAQRAPYVCYPNEPGSLLVFPLVDNINYTTHIDISNRATTDVWLQGLMVVHDEDAEEGEFEKTIRAIIITIATAQLKRLFAMFVYLLSFKYLTV